MKKYLKYFSLMFIVLLVVTGCSSKAPDKQLEDAIKKTSEVKSLKESINQEISFKQYGQTMSFSLGADIDAYQESDTSSTAYAKIKAAMTGISYQFDGYFDVNDNNFGMYINLANKWMKIEQELNEQEYKSSLEQYKEIIDKYNDYDYTKIIKEVKEEETDKKGYTKLNVVFDKDKINEEFKNIYSATIEETKKQLKNEMTDVEYTEEELKEALSEVEDVFKNDLLSKDFSATIYLKDGYVAIMDFEAGEIFKDIVSNLSKSIDSESVDVEKQLDELDLKYHINIEFSDFNAIEPIKVPDEAKNGLDLINMTEEQQTELGNSIFSSILGM